MTFTLHHHVSQKGFSLIELAVVLTVIGITMGSLMAMLGPYLESAKYDTTQERLEKIASALAVYAQNNYRLPCPANNNPTAGVDEPFGSPKNSGINGLIDTNACSAAAYVAADYIGIVPFRALGLSEENVKDGFGNFITYEVAPVMAGNRGTNVHEQCRTPAWIDGATNKNPRKALFCCPEAVGGFTARPFVFDKVAVTRHELFTAPAWDDVAGSSRYGASNSIYYGVPATSNQLIAYVLVSHGRNGDSAFIKGGGRRAVTAAGSEEQLNGYTNQQNVSQPQNSLSGATYFDDILLWRTNTQIMSELGNDSCTRP